MSGFANAVVGGLGTLVRTFIRSINYVAGVSGWTINKDGTAEFNNLTLRGQETLGNPLGQHIVLDGVNGQFLIYDSTNTLVASINGNGYIHLFGQGANNTAEVFLETDLFGSPVFAGYPVGNNTLWATQGIVSFGLRGAGNTLQGTATFQAAVPRPNGTTPQIVLVTNDVNNDGSEVHINSTGAVGTIQLEATTSVYSTALYGTSPANGLAEPWNALTFQNGWANVGAPFTTGHYRLVASPANSVQIVGVFNPGATKADGTTIATLPTDYHPISTNINPVYVNTMTTQSPSFELDTSGNVKCFGCSSATSVFVNAMFPLDI
jgi:hypothetical protein